MQEDWMYGVNHSFFRKVDDSSEVEVDTGDKPPLATYPRLCGTKIMLGYRGSELELTP